MLVNGWPILVGELLAYICHGLATARLRQFKGAFDRRFHAAGRVEKNASRIVTQCVSARAARQAQLVLRVCRSELVDLRATVIAGAVGAGQLRKCHGPNVKSLIVSRYFAIKRVAEMRTSSVFTAALSVLVLAACDTPEARITALEANMTASEAAARADGRLRADRLDQRAQQLEAESARAGGAEGRSLANEAIVDRTEAAAIRDEADMDAARIFNAGEARIEALNPRNASGAAARP